MATAKARYALRAMTALAAHYGKGILNAPKIADAEGIPGRFCENMLTHLKLMGLLDSERGKDGGFWLRRAPDQITVADVIQAVDGRIGPASFTALASANSGDAVPVDRDCEVRALFQRAHAAMVAVLREETLADLVAKRSQRLAG